VVLFQRKAVHAGILMESVKPCTVGLEVSTAVVMKSIIFCDMTPCSPLSLNQRFGGTYRLHLQGRRNKFGNKPASKRQATCLLPGFLLNLFLLP
jgi:hypothetical protein